MSGGRGCPATPDTPPEWVHVHPEPLASESPSWDRGGWQGAGDRAGRDDLRRVDVDVDVDVCGRRGMTDVTAVPGRGIGREAPRDQEGARGNQGDGRGEAQLSPERRRDGAGERPAGSERRQGPRAEAAMKSPASAGWPSAAAVVRPA